MLNTLKRVETPPKQPHQPLPSDSRPVVGTHLPVVAEMIDPKDLTDCYQGELANVQISFRYLRFTNSLMLPIKFP